MAATVVEAQAPNGHARRRAVTREKVLAAAREIIAEGGREALTVVAVATRAGVSEGTVYKIFYSRDDLAAAAMLDVSDLWIDAVAATPARLHPLRRILRAHLGIVGGVPEEELLLRTVMAQRPRTTTEQGLRHQAQDMLARSCAAGLTRSPRSKVSPTDALLWSHVYVAAIRTLGERYADFDELTSYVDTIVS